MRKNGFFLPLILVVIAIGAAVIGFVIYYQYSPNSELLPFPITKPSDEITNWLTYSNEDLGFSVKYSPDYEINEKKFGGKVGWVTFSSKDLEWEDFGGGTFPKKGGEIRISTEMKVVSIVKDIYALTYLPKKISEHKITLDNVESSYIVEEHLSDFKSHQIIADKDGEQFILYAFFASRNEKDIVDVFQKMTSTFIFLD